MLITATYQEELEPAELPHECTVENIHQSPPQARFSWRSLQLPTRLL